MASNPISDQMSSTEQAWEEYKGHADPIPYSWDETHRNAFHAGMQAGIKYAVSQIEWNIQDRAKEII